MSPSRAGAGEARGPRLPRGCPARGIRREGGKWSRHRRFSASRRPNFVAAGEPLRGARARAAGAGRKCSVGSCRRAKGLVTVRGRRLARRRLLRRVLYFRSCTWSPLPGEPRSWRRCWARRSTPTSSARRRRSRTPSRPSRPTRERGGRGSAVFKHAGVELMCRADSGVYAAPRGPSASRRCSRGGGAGVAADAARGADPRHLVALPPGGGARLRAARDAAGARAGRAPPGVERAGARLVRQRRRRVGRSGTLRKTAPYGNRWSSSRGGCARAGRAALELELGGSRWAASSSASSPSAAARRPPPPRGGPHVLRHGGARAQRRRPHRLRRALPRGRPAGHLLLRDRRRPRRRGARRPGTLNGHRADGTSPTASTSSSSRGSTCSRGSRSAASGAGPRHAPRRAATIRAASGGEGLIVRTIRPDSRAFSVALNPKVATVGELREKRRSSSTAMSTTGCNCGSTAS